MGLLPNYEQAQFPLEKLTEYALSMSHPVGRHKALAFKNKLGVSMTEAMWLRGKILEEIANNDAVEVHPSPYGRRFYMDIPLRFMDQTATVRSTWIIPAKSGIPCLTSCYPI